MANETITFSCAACGIKLTVPASLAGISGPCPSCSAQIQAPTLNAPPQMVANPGAPPPAVAVPEPPPLGIPGATVQMPPPPAPAVAEGMPTPLKPEPRHVPQRSHPAEVVAKQMPEPRHSSHSARPKAAPLGKHPHQSSLLARFLMLILFLIASGALVFGVLTVLKMQEKNSGGDYEAPPTLETPSTLGVPAPEEKREPPRVPALPTPPSPEALIAPVPELPKGIKPRPRGMEALAVLEKFLAANSLAERLPIIETQTPEAELASSCLAGPLPPAPKMLLEFQESNPLEEVVDFYYSVDFEGTDHRANPQTILVRVRGRGDPKVVVDPFLDLFGGRLAAFASKPREKGGVFQVIASPLASCTNTDVPNREKKRTLKLLPRDNTKEVAEAYFSKISKINEMLEDGTYNLSYGKAKACTVMLRWNTEENPKMPYLEALVIKALDWNP